MKAFRLHREGGLEQLVYEDAPKPQLGAGDALIRIHAAAQGNRSRRGVFFIVRPDREQLGQIATLIDAGAVRPVIAPTVPLAEAREAFERGVVAGHTRGKLVLAVEKL
jgi:NADPH:quinone reductase-like Zn-dependent oxidoreductase